MIFIKKIFSKKKIQVPPLLALVLLYIACAFIGAILLSLPFVSSKSTTFFDNLFTAVSSITVTGLMVTDAGNDYNFFGQLVITILIHLGGLGLMTLSVLILSMLGMRIPVSQHILLGDDLSQNNIGGIMKLVSVIFKVVIIFELLGVFFLSLHFVPEFGWKKGLWHSIFHSVSSFNNAGISLYTNSLSNYVGNYNINITITTLFIVGGLGYSVIMDIFNKRSWNKLNLHSKLTLTGTLILIIWGFCFFMILEWNNPKTLGNLDIDTKILASWFQITAARTSGFNSVDISYIKDSTAFMITPLMVIGGGSTSTAGGIKVTTFMVITLAVISFFKRQEEISVYGRSLQLIQVFKAMALVIISLFFIMTCLFAITITNSDIRFLDLLFEVCSSFGTNGMSRGITKDLDAFGRIIIMIIMMVGRIGPLSLALFLSKQTTSRVKYPEENVQLV